METHAKDPEETVALPRHRFGPSALLRRLEEPSA